MDKSSPASCFKIFPKLFSPEGFLSFFPKICSICYISPLTSLVVIMCFAFHKNNPLRLEFHCFSAFDIFISSIVYLPSVFPFPFRGQGRG